MPALFFPSLDALRLVLASGIVPPATTDAPAHARLDDHGRLWLEPVVPLPQEVIGPLARMGVQVLGDPGQPGEAVACWAELLPLRRCDAPPAGTILFELLDTRLVEFTGRVRRLHGPAFAARLLDDVARAWVVVDRPPLSLLLADDADAYAERSPGVWVRLGWEHPLPDRLVVPAGGVVLCGPPRQQLRRAGPVPAVAVEDVFVRGVRPAACLSSLAPRIPVTLRLAAASSRPPESLWVFVGNAVGRFLEYCGTADQRQLRLFEASGMVADGIAGYVVRAVAGKAPVPILPLPGVGYCADARAPGLFVPAGRELRPTLRPAELARLLNLTPGQLTWVASGPSGELFPHRVPLTAFRPLPELLAYRVPATHPLSDVMGGVAHFDFERFAPSPTHDQPARPDEGDLEGAAEAAEPDGRAAPSTGWLGRAIRRLSRRLIRRHAEPPVEESAAPTEPARRPRRTTPESAGIGRTMASPDALLHGQHRAARRAELESRLLAEFARLGPEQRATRWADLAAVYGATGNSADAAVCWINAAWEVAEPPEPWLEQWFLCECRVAKQTAPNVSLDRWLSEPGRFGVGRVIAAFTVCVGSRAVPPAELVANLPRVLSFLEQHFDDLPARAAWLARRTLTRLCAGDALGLARWRDRILGRLRDRGPGLDLDEPSFLRFHGTASPERFQKARDWLTRARDPILKWVSELGTPGRLQFAGIDPETDCTANYAQLMLAWGLGYLGERTRAIDWAARARKVLIHASGPQVDPAVHALLADLFLHRLRDAHEGRSPRPGLPPELVARYDRLGEFSRYAVDKFRRFSRILEPVNRVREYTGKEFKEFWGHDRLGERLFVLADRADAAYLTDEARTLLAACAADPSSEVVPRVTFTLLEVAPHLHPSLVGPLLGQVVPALDWLETWLQAGRWSDAERPDRLFSFHARVLENAFAAAAWFGQPAAVRLLVLHLLRRVPSDPVLRQAVTRAAGPLFRAFHKLQFRTEAEALSRALDPTEGEAWPADSPFPPSRLGLAVGWFAAGDEDAGYRILNEARDRLFRPRPAEDRDRTRLAIAYAEVLGFAPPPPVALGRLEEIFQQFHSVSVTGSTNRYFTLKPLELIDTVVRSVVTEEFALGPAVRGWLDDDEFLTRRRIHRDLADVLREEGLR